MTQLTKELAALLTEPETVEHPVIHTTTHTVVEEVTTSVMPVPVKWETPLPLGTTGPLPDFPVSALPEWLAEFVTAEAEATQTPVDMAAMFSLTALATALGGKVVVEPRAGWREGVNLFVAVAMEPGSRKSAVHRDTTKPVTAFEQQLMMDKKPEVAEQASRRRRAEAELKALEGAAAKGEAGAGADADDLARRLEEDPDLQVPPVPRLFASDTTPEALGSLLYEHGGRIAVLSAEGGIFDLMAGKYSNGVPNIDVFLSGHAGDSLRVDRKNRTPEFVETPALTIGIAVQPQVLEKAAKDRDMAGRGLLARFLYAIPKGNVGHREMEPEPVPQSVAAAYEAHVTALLEAGVKIMGATTLTLTDVAKKALVAWQRTIEPRRRPTADLGAIQAWASKLDGAVVRLAGLLHIAHHGVAGLSIPIEEPTVEAAILIGDYLIAHALVAFEVMGGDQVTTGAKAVYEWAVANGTDDGNGNVVVSKRDLHQAHKGTFKTIEDFDPVVNLLIDTGYFEPVPLDYKRGRGRRPSPTFMVNTTAHNSHNSQNWRADPPRSISENCETDFGGERQ